MIRVHHLRATTGTVIFLLALSAACMDTLGTGAGRANLILTPAFGELAAFADNADRLRIVVRGAADLRLVADTVVAIDPATGDAAADIRVQLTGASELFEVLLQAIRSSDDVVLFEGRETVTVTGGSDPQPVAIPVSYTGPTGVRVTIQPQDTVVARGITFTFAALVEDDRGAAAPVPVVFDVLPAGSTVLTVSRYTGQATTSPTDSGTALVVAATADGLKDTARVVVAVVGRILVTPASATLTALGATQQLVAQASDPLGNPVSPQPAFTWTSSATSVATVSAAGLVTAVGNGTAMVTANVGGVSATATITIGQEASSVVVTPPAATLTALGATQQYVADARDANGNALAVQPTFTWASSAPDVATIAASGVATAVANGGTTITATGAGVSGTASLSVSQVVEALAFTVQPSTVRAGANITPAVQVTALDASGKVALNFTQTVTIALATNPSGAALAGTTAAAAAAGVATFADLNIDRGGTGYTLMATTGSITAMSQAFDVVVATGGMIATGGEHTCGSPGGGTLYCWGRNTNGQLGLGDLAGRPVPTAVPDLQFADVTAGRQNHTCGFTTDGEDHCWGWNGYGQLGVGDTDDRVSPVPVPGDYAVLSASSYATCGVTATGAAYCWGRNDFGQLGVGDYSTRTSPAMVSGDLQFSTVGGGLFHACGLTTDGVAYCWGDDRYNQLGDGSGAGGSNTVPVLVAGGLTFRSLSVSDYRACGITADGETYCWGYATAGGLGLGGEDVVRQVNVPTAVTGGVRFSEINLGAEHTCGIATDGTLYCWGYNEYGQLGVGDLQNHTSPVAVTGSLAALRVAAGGLHTCALTANAEIYCWGRNDYGQLGDGTTVNKAVPTKILE